MQASDRIAAESTGFTLQTLHGEINFMTSTDLAPSQRYYLIRGQELTGVLRLTVKNGYFGDIIFEEGAPHLATGRVCKIPALSFEDNPH